MTEPIVLTVPAWAALLWLIGTIVSIGVTLRHTHYLKQQIRLLSSEGGSDGDSGG